MIDLVHARPELAFDQLPAAHAGIERGQCAPQPRAHGGQQRAAENPEGETAQESDQLAGQPHRGEDSAHGQKNDHGQGAASEHVVVEPLGVGEHVSQAELPGDVDRPAEHGQHDQPLGQGL